MLRYRPIHFYQSQPGLTTLSEIEVEHLVELAKGRREDALWVIPLVWNTLLWIVVMGPLVWLALVMRAAAASARTAATNGTSPPTTGASWTVSDLGAVLVVSIAAGVMVVISAVVWVWIRRRLIMRSIRLLMAKSACPFCDFDLRGLRVADGVVVRCPECGQIVVLSDHGMTRRDLLLDEGFVPPPVSPLWPTADAGPPDPSSKPVKTGSPIKPAPAHAANGRSSSSTFTGN